METEYISLSDAASLVGLSRQHLNYLARSGQLPALKIGRNWVTTREAVEEYARDAFKRSKDPLKKRR